MKKTIAVLAMALLLVCLFSTVAFADANFQKGWNDNNRTYVGDSLPKKCAIGNDSFIQSEWESKGSKVITVNGEKWNATQYTGRCDACLAKVWISSHWVQTGPGPLQGYWKEGYWKYTACPGNEHIFTAYVLTSKVTPTDPCAKGHSLTKVNAKEANCVEAGNMEYWTCGTCKKLFEDAKGKTETTQQDVTLAVNPNNHKGGYEWKDGCADHETATCTQHDQYCKACKKPTGAKADHTFGEWQITKPATESDAGSQKRTCTCGHFETQTIPATGHTHTSANLKKEAKKDATCTKGGNIEYYTCVECEGKYFDEKGNQIAATTVFTNPLGHDFEGAECEPADTDPEGVQYHKWICTRCEGALEGGIKKEACNAEDEPWLDHCEEEDCDQYDAAKCHRHCPKCNQLYDELEHEFDEGAVTTTPTCTEEGVKTFKCKNCGHQKTEPVVKLDHVPSEWKYQLTYDGKLYTNPDEHVKVCVNCGMLLNHEVHKFGKGLVTKMPDCWNDGEVKYTCSTCGYAKYETLPALGHWFETVELKSTCTGEGYTAKKCVRCGLIIGKDKVDPAGHKPGEWETVKAPTCTEAGEEIQKCTVCGVLLDTREVAATGHDWGEWTVVTPATTEKEGLEKRVCKNDESHVETRPIAKLEPTDQPTQEPTDEPATEPTVEPTQEPTQEPADDNDKKDDGKTDIPKTGDSRNLGIVYLMMAMAAAGLCVLAATRKEGKN